MTPQEACWKVMENAKEPALNYAVNYAKYGATLQQGEELRVQCIYILGNIVRWRGDLAKEVRSALKKYVGVK